MMQVSKKIPFEDPDVLMYVRGAYILSNVIIAGIYLYVQAKINAKKGKQDTYATWAVDFLLTYLKQI